MSKEMSKEIILKLTPEDMGGNFKDNHDCPIYRGLKRNGYDVTSVGGYTIGFCDETVLYRIKCADTINDRIRGKEENIQVTLIKM